MTIKFSNNASTTLATDILANTTSINVTNAAAFPDLPLGTDYFYSTIEDAGGNIEIIKVTAINKSTNTFTTVVRGQESTTQRAFTAGARIECRVTAGTLDEVVTGANNAAQYNATTYAVDNNTTANSYDVDYTPAITSLTDGMDLWFKPGASNTGASTLDVNDGSGAKDIIFPNGVTLSTNVIIINTVVHVTYSTYFGKWILQNPVFFPATMVANSLLTSTDNNQVVDSGIPKTEVYRNTQDLLPDTTATRDLGSATLSFADTYTNRMLIGSRVTGNDFTFDSALTKITSTSTDLSVFSPYDKITISNAANGENNDSWLVASATTNELVVETAGFVNESPGANLITITSFIPTTGIVDEIPNSTTATQLVQVGAVKEYIDSRLLYTETTPVSFTAVNTTYNLVHGLGVKPWSVQVVLVASATPQGSYDEGDELHLDSINSAAAEGNHNARWAVGVTTDAGGAYDINVSIWSNVQYPNGDSLYIPNKNGGWVNLNPAAWASIKAYVIAVV